MTHGDDNGLVLPPAVAPIQVIVVPIAQHKEGVLDRLMLFATNSKRFAELRLTTVKIHRAGSLRNMK